ncbi:hypothetical protein LTR62_008318 [Meristemomyces frigidus]|uniref:Calpain catalytic domain-containing protein n=1 Tax=Meristemomyces frigidus TaxID=1508187 RepID=A0AAN7YNB9_9PEZI|nr:hypothetical protein LTR62_008318 [Meristemomyces frigidus]
MSSSESDNTRPSRVRPKRRKDDDDPGLLHYGYPPPRPMPRKPPQAVIDEHWTSFDSKFPGKISTVLPNNYHAKKLAQRPDADEGTHNAVESFEEAAKICRQKVDKIVGECRRVNQKYRDPHFDLEQDFYVNGYAECLRGLMEKKNDPKLEPKSVKRVGAIFETPQFFIQGATSNDVRQGRNGDCWLMSALGTVSNCQGLIEKICVHRDEKVGVYGFVFCRDGAWISEVVDDKLYLLNEDFHDRKDREDPEGGMKHWSQVQDRRTVAKEYKKRFQTGSKALYFAQCSDPNETWLPLLEKAFAKAHQDYLAVEGGFVGEAIEDLTGGVTSELHGTDILDRDAFWTDELLQVNEQFLFGCGQSRGFDEDRNGLQHRHAYSIMEAREVDGLRLVKLRNPWGNTEWTGAWADGSEEWTAEWLQKLNHKFGNDGVFWMLYDDLLEVCEHFDRTRLFDDSWQITQQWISLQVPWTIDYHDTSFRVTVSQPGDVVIVLSQLDDRYFRGLEGQYSFTLHFRVHREGESDYLVRSPSSYNMRRSISTEVFLEPGSYTVMIKIVASFSRFRIPTEDVVRQAAKLHRRDKLLAVGLSRDLAYNKVQVLEHDKAREAQLTRERRAKRKQHAKAAKAFKQSAWVKHKVVAAKVADRFEAKRFNLLPTTSEPEGEGQGPKTPTRYFEPARMPTPETDSVIDKTQMERVGDGTPADQRDTVVGAPTPRDYDESTETVTDPLQVGGMETVAAQMDEQDVTATEQASTKDGITKSKPADREELDASPEEMAEVLVSETVDPDENPQPIPSSSKPVDLAERPQKTNNDFFPVSTHREPTRQTTFGTNNTDNTDNTNLNPNPNSNPKEEEINEADLSWDSEIDCPTDSDADAVVKDNPFLPPRPPPIISPREEINEQGVAGEEQLSTEPWNAVVVVGLRVFAKRGNEVGVGVRWPGCDV